MTENVEMNVNEEMKEVINPRDREFFNFEKECNETLDGFKNDTPDFKPEEIEELCSNFLMENVKVYVTEKGNILKTLFGHKLTEKRSKDGTLIGVCMTLFGKYKNKTREYLHLTEFNKWYEEQVDNCKTSKETKEVEVTETTSTTDFTSVVFSLGGNDYSFEGMKGMKFVFKKSEDNGIRFEMERLVG